ncbi:MAG: hypothetical protein LBI80_03705 [Endomicrobium sp.]|jgi:hypothetical protein|nr:hypothetical protein [Endomicrobium sp.]
MNKNVLHFIAALVCVCVASDIGIANSVDLGEISINFGTDLVSKTEVKNIGSNDLGYGGYGGGTVGGLESLRNLCDNSLTDGYWSHKNNIILGFDYLHSIFKKVKIGFGTKLIEKKVKADYIAYLEKNPTPPNHSYNTGDFQILPINKNLASPDAHPVSPAPFRELYFLPVYFTAQINPIDILSSIYFKGKVGCNFVVKDDMPDIDGYVDSSLWKFKRGSGLYFGLEVGNEFGLSEKAFFILGLFYDYIEYRTSQAEDGMAHEHKDAGWFTNVDHTIGIKTGLKFKL